MTHILLTSIQCKINLRLKLTGLTFFKKVAEIENYISTFSSQFHSILRGTFSTYSSNFHNIFNTTVHFFHENSLYITLGVKHLVPPEQERKTNFELQHSQGWNEKAGLI